MINKPKECQGCPLHNVGIGFVPFQIKPGPIMLVGEAPGEDEASSGQCFSGGSGQWLRNLTASARLRWQDLTLTNTILCRPPGNIYPTDPKWDPISTGVSRDAAAKAVEYCKRTHLLPNVARANKPKLFAIGAQALKQLTGKEGIHTWRGSPLPLIGTSDRPRVIGTIHPAALMRQAKLSSVVVKDFQKSLILPPENYNLFPTLEELEKFHAKVFAFDLEWDSMGNVTVCGLSDRFYTALVVPWIDPYLSILKRIFENATDIIGHNIISADMPFIERMGWDTSRATIHDTMLKQHLIQPDYPHSRAFFPVVGRWVLVSRTSRRDREST